MRKITFIFVLCVLMLYNVPVKASEINAPSINGKAAITIDYNTGEIIYANNIDTKMYPASITKLMTALIFVDNYKASDTLTYTQEAKSQEPFSFDNNLQNTKINALFKAEDTMKIMLMVSANDMATMIADNISGSTSEFSNLMNSKAIQLKMLNTHFMTANGLPNPDHYTTAYDLSLLGKAAYLNPWISTVLSTETTEIIRNGETLKLKNTNKLLGQYGCIAGKTGFTNDAGRCLFSVFERNGQKLISIVLAAPDDKKGELVYDDTLKIVNWSYEALKSSYIKKGAVVYTTVLEYKPFKYFGASVKLTIPFAIKEDALYYSNYVNDKEIYSTIKLNSLDPLKLSKNISQGSYTLHERDCEKAYALYPTIDTEYINNINQGIYSKIAVFALYLYFENILLVLFISLILVLIRSIIIRRKTKTT